MSFRLGSSGEIVGAWHLGNRHSGVFRVSFVLRFQLVLALASVFEVVVFELGFSLRRWGEFFEVRSWSWFLAAA